MMFDIEEYIFRNFDDAKSYGNPQTDWAINCIRCDDSKYHLNVSIDKQVVHCWRCGYSASWIGFVMENSGVPYYKAIAELYKIPSMKEFRKSVSVIADPMALHKSVEAQLPEDFHLLSEVDESYSVYKRYMSNRGFDEITCDRYDIGVADSMSGRIIIPIEKGYWQGRSVYKWLKPKYLNPKSEARDILFNSQALQLYDEVVVCEGAFSAMAVGDNAVALIGKEATEEKLLRLVTASVTNYIIALEAGAWKTVQKLAEGLYRAGKTVTIWNYSIGDPADPVNKFEIMNYDLKTRLSLDLEA